MHPKLSWLFSALLSSSATAQGGDTGLFRFFAGRDIDYWSEGRMVHDTLKMNIANNPRDPDTDPLASFSGSNLVRSGDSVPFTWSRYEDPKLAEFWDDGGDWIPPRPFREAASDPSPENIRRYLAWQQRKALVTRRFQSALIKQDQPAVDLEATVPWRKLHIIYFYQSLCSHCQASRNFVEALKKRGVAFTFVQLDYGQNPPLHSSSIPYSESLAQRFTIEATPTWVLRIGSKTQTHVGELSMKKLSELTTSLIKEEGRS